MIAKVIRDSVSVYTVFIASMRHDEIAYFVRRNSSTSLIEVRLRKDKMRSASFSKSARASGGGPNSTSCRNIPGTNYEISE